MVHFKVEGFFVVRSADEISYHRIESAHAAMRLQRMAVLSTPSPLKNAHILAAGVQDMHAKVAEPELSSDGQQQQGSNQRLRSEIITFLQKEGECQEQGVSITLIYRAVKAFGNEDEVRRVLDQLVDVGD